MTSLIAQADCFRIPLADESFDVVLADPPWQYEVWSTKTSNKRGAGEAYYPTMTSKQIAALPIEHLAADNAALFFMGAVVQVVRGHRRDRGMGIPLCDDRIPLGEGASIGPRFPFRHGKVYAQKHGAMPVRYSRIHATYGPIGIGADLCACSGSQS